MASFDIVSKVDIQQLDNAINTVKKEISTRYDFKGSHVEIELNKKDLKLVIESENEMKMGQVLDVLITRSMRQNLDPKCFDMEKEAYGSGKILKKDIVIRNGIPQDIIKKINKAIKDSGLKVQSAVMDDLIRVTAKKIDDLQAVISLCKTNDFGIPLQYINMK
ncbi:MAG: YajQ family cyclic di-GMP-binding protein [Saprospiraceae bacterium]|jgi:uncharacterized protein YajQ (UPF0234 family)|nr:YajQ family cyclic di-GMP-binding protein [Saprospiraceae bacterium]